MHILLVHTISVFLISFTLQCNAVPVVNSGNAKSNPSHQSQSYSKNSQNIAAPDNQMPAVPAVVASKILSNYYNSLRAPVQYVHPLTLENWPRPEVVPLVNVPLPEEYDDGEGDYYFDNFRPKPPSSEIYYGSPAYQPEGWFEGPMIPDEPESDSNAQTDTEEAADDTEFGNLMLNYFIEQMERQNKNSEKELINKRKESQLNVRSSMVTPVPTSASMPIKATVTTSIPKKQHAALVNVFHRGQKEYPMLRPASDTNDRSSRNEKPIEWPSELDEQKLSEEESLMSLKKGQLRTTRDVLTAQLDNLKKESNKIMKSKLI